MRCRSALSERARIPCGIESFHRHHPVEDRSLHTTNSTGDANLPVFFVSGNGNDHVWNPTSSILSKRTRTVLVTVSGWSVCILIDPVCCEMIGVWKGKVGVAYCGLLLHTAMAKRDKQKKPVDAEKEKEK